ncbi:16S rRNA (guanine(966)-N(2))-methyltransferase RsmD [Nocardioides daejeonensis]|uniref:16S rRNA (guanine(966)-N(2))-methyltransferase RsmD n=1 Tax=Nocardioides daejeonensis TaxID=1046556 RepID=UPI000D747385|nr:16S rRNA (guanine(966)-N(2))-methyltransferase RsmD [Nocardioides daejeonensis]
MTRIIGGSAGGRRLEAPRGSNTRPTSDRVREALFSAVESWCGSWQGLRVLDLYAGTGAVGLEAISRGAEEAILVEQDRRTAELIGRNARTLGFAQARVVTASVATYLGQSEPVPCHVVFLDPPYPLANDRVADDLALLVDRGWLGDDALVVVERSKRGGLPAWPVGISPLRERKYGETVLGYGHAAPDTSTSGE